MTISADQIYLLNKMNSTAATVQLGTLIQNAESVVASEIALANGKVFVGNGSDVAAAVSLSGDATIDNLGAMTIANSAITNAKVSASAAIAGTKVSPTFGAAVSGTAYTATATTNQVVLGTTNTTTISATAPAASRVYTLPDVLGAADFVMTAGAQTLGGVKTFSAQPVFSAGVAHTRANVASTATIASLASSTSYVKLTGSTATDLQGIAAGVNGQLLILTNLTGQNLTIRNQSASAASGAKITTMTGADITTTANGAAGFIYDTDASPAEWTCIWTTA